MVDWVVHAATQMVGQVWAGSLCLRWHLDHLETDRDGAGSDQVARAL